MAAKSRRSSKPIPPLRRHKALDKAYVRIDGQFIYLGKWGQPETQEEYQRFVAEYLLGNSRRLGQSEGLTIIELIDRYVEYAQGYYRTSDGKANREYANVCIALRRLMKLYGHTEAGEFGPLALRAVREQMIRLEWCRVNINHNVGRIKRMFRWATENELVGGEVFHALQAVLGLKRGRSTARDNPPIKPVPNEWVDAVEPFVSAPVWAMICLQRLTGARGGEICIMRPCDIDRSEPIWAYRPSDHKTSYRDQERVIYIGPKAQEALAPFLLRPPEAFCFSPKEAEQQRRKLLTESRVTPLCCGNRCETNRKDEPRKQPKERYTSGSYGRAVQYALKKAFPPPAELCRRKGESYRHFKMRLTDEQREQLKQWDKKHHWHPHQLRHNAATELRKAFGLDVARIILGHRSADITQIYAEQDKDKAVQAIQKVG